MSESWIVIDTSTIRETIKGNAALGIDLPRLSPDDTQRAFRGLRALWHVLKTATRASELEEGRVFKFEGERRPFRPSAITAELDRTESLWAGIFERVVAEPPIGPG